jgi:hypothetical protein
MALLGNLKEEEKAFVISNLRTYLYCPKLDTITTTRIQLKHSGKNISDTWRK